MTSLSDWASLFGYLCLFLSLLAGFYFMLPGPRRADEDGDWRLRRKTAPPPDMAATIAAAEAHERHAPGHARRVADMAIALAEAVAFPPADRARLERAALLHDVGVLDVPAEPFDRADLLAPADHLRLQAHAGAGAARAEQLTKDPAVAQWVRWSHERWDGLGYPDGLAGDQIPLPSRILRLADSAEAMLQARPHRPAMAPSEVADAINRDAGMAYDPELARVFVDYVLPRQAGSVSDVT